jgi:hypothetical protein
MAKDASRAKPRDMRFQKPGGASCSWLSHGLAGGEPRGSARRPRARARRSPGAAAAAASWRTQRIRSAAAWGWSPNSWAIRLTQPRVPSRRTARLIAAATLSAEGASDRCSAEANSASHHASSRFSRVLAVLPAGDVRAGRGPARRERGHRGGRSGRATRRRSGPACGWICSMRWSWVSLLTRRLSCAGDLAGGRGAGRQGAPGGYSTGPISAPASSA